MENKENQINLRPEINIKYLKIHEPYFINTMTTRAEKRLKNKKPRVKNKKL